MSGHRLRAKFCQIWWRNEALNALERKSLKQGFQAI
jgi:hypothetical protein